MRSLELALFAEGPTDYRFLGPVLRRLTESICLACEKSPVEIGEIKELRVPREAQGGDRATRICAAVRDAWGSFHVLFIHADGAGDPITTRDVEIGSAIQRIAREPSGQGLGMVAVVPVRETEAWALVDGDALRAAFGTDAPDPRLGIPSLFREVEGLLDPKRVLEQALRTAVGSRRRKRGVTAAAFLNVIGERVRLEHLRQVPAFRQLEQDFLTALRGLGYLEPER